MAKKNQQRPNSFTAPQGFTHGMVSDADPRFQLQGSYSDALNVRLINSDGSTFTVENIEGNSLFVDLAKGNGPTIYKQSQPNGISGYPTFFDIGPTSGSWSDRRNNLKLDNRCSIVGHVSYANQLLLIIVGRFEYDENQNPDPKNRTIFLLVDFDKDFTVTQVTDLQVCYTTSGGMAPDLNMDLDRPIRVEHLIENENIHRIYWTDNKNPLRTINIRQSSSWSVTGGKYGEGLRNLSVDSLAITPLMSPSQVTLSKTLHGSLPVGVFQYTYKYISENGGETGFAPISNMFHVSDQSFGSSVDYGGGPQGNLGSQGFTLSISDLDQDFDYVELYALYYDSIDTPPRVAVVTKRKIAGSTMKIDHVFWNNEIPQGLEEVLIESNTWDVCKDIAIKDNILFAANLRSKRNWISEKEWNVKVLRWRIKEGGSSTTLDAMLTTDDRAIKHYEDTGSGAVEIKDGIDGYKKDYNDFHCGYGQLLGADNSAYTATSHSYLISDGTIGNPMWTTSVENQRGGSGGTTPRYKTVFEYRYLSDRMTLGGESFNYITNNLGGCRVSFGIKEREVDQTQNTSTSPYVSATSAGEEFQTDNISQQAGESVSTNNTETKFQTSMSLGGSYDPHAAGNKRGYQRGEVYRFGVQVYDLNGSPGNVLWIGDIQTPEQHDVLRMIDVKNEAGRGTNYTPIGLQLILQA